MPNTPAPHYVCDCSFYLLRGWLLPKPWSHWSVLHMHENYIRDDAVVEAFEIIMRQMIMPQDVATQQLWVAAVEEKKTGFSEKKKNGGTWVSAVFIFTLLHQIVASPQNFKQRLGLNSGLMKKSPASSSLLVCRQTRLSEQTSHLCATCSADETPVKVVQ